MLDDGRGRERDEEEGGARMREQRGEGKNEKVFKKMKNENVARGRIVDPRGLVSLIHIAAMIENS